MLRMLAAGDFPEHQTLCEFSERHLEDCRAVSVEVVRLAGAMELEGPAAGGRHEVSGEREQAEADDARPGDEGGGAAGVAPVADDPGPAIPSIGTDLMQGMTASRAGPKVHRAHQWRIPAATFAPLWGRA